MILFFRFKNFRTFRQETLINMQAAGYKELPDHLAVLDCPSGKKGVSGTSSVSKAAAHSDKKLIKTLAVYGPNASGKSHIIAALQFYCDFINRQLLLPTPDAQQTRSLLNAHPFLSEVPVPELPNPAGLPLSMCMQFFFQGYLFEYGFTLSDGEVTEEAFLVNKKVLFQKNMDEIRPGKIFQSVIKKTVPLKTKGSSLGTFLNYHTDEFAPVNQAFISFFQQSFLSFDHSCLCRINQFPSFGAVQAKKILALPSAGDFIYSQLLALQLPVLSSREEFVNQLDPFACSTGLTKIILLLYRCYCLQQTGGILIVDDLTAFLHPNVSRYLLKLFQSSHTQNLQLIFTTHDTALLNRSQFRRDEVAIVSMNHTGLSHLHTLADIRVRADASFSKDYLAGKYGIVPVWEEPEQ
ncbi:MAG: ATP-binding protein [Lachnospiraceae bacterium]|nr:ATP-binding protein [Lachnospiraceae bacterium]